MLTELTRILMGKLWQIGNLSSTYGINSPFAHTDWVFPLGVVSFFLCPEINQSTDPVNVTWPLPPLALGCRP